MTVLTGRKRRRYDAMIAISAGLPNRGSFVLQGVRTKQPVHLRLQSAAWMRPALSECGHWDVRPLPCRQAQKDYEKQHTGKKVRHLVRYTPHECRGAQNVKKLRIQRLPSFSRLKERLRKPSSENEEHPAKPAEL